MGPWLGGEGGDWLGTKPFHKAVRPSLSQFLPPLLQLLSLIPPPHTKLLGSAPAGKKNAQFVMSCPAVNLPLPSHRRDLLSSIYLFATRTMDGPRPAELFIIMPPTIPPPCASPSQQHQLRSCRCHQALTSAGIPAPLKALDTMKKATVKGCGQGWEDPLTGRMPGLGSCEKTHNKEGEERKANDNHHSGKFILPLWGCWDGKKRCVQPHRQFLGGPRPGIVTVALETLSN